MSPQQTQRNIRLPSGLENCPSQNLDTGIIGVILRESISEFDCGIGIPRRVQRQRLHGGEIRSVLFGVDIGDGGVGLAEGDLGAEFEEASWELVLWGEGGGVEVEDGLILALVEGVVDVD